MKRIILESLKEKPRPLANIIKDTGLDERIVLNTLRLLLDSNIVQHNPSGFCIDFQTFSQLSGDEREEVKELMSRIVDQYFEQKDSSISLKKVWMTEEDEKIFQNMLEGIERFLGELKIYNQNLDRPLGEKKFFTGDFLPIKMP